MKYYFIVYHFKVAEGWGFGNIAVESVSFINREELLTSIAAMYPEIKKCDIVVTTLNLISKKEYEAWIKK